LGGLVGEVSSSKKILEGFRGHLEIFSCVTIWWGEFTTLLVHLEGFNPLLEKVGLRIWGVKPFGGKPFNDPEFS